jgi:flagellar biosynthetic protein FliR
MVNLLPLIQDYIPLFGVILIRVAGIVVAIPAFSSRSVPLHVRIGLLIGFTVILFPIVSDQMRPLSLSWPQVVPLLFTEFMVGMVLGFAISFVMNAFIIAGELIGIQMGINLISALDPVAGGQVPILGQFMGLLGMLIFLAIDGHHMMFEALVASFQLVPPMHVHFSGFLVESVLKLGLGMFVLALKVGAPVMTAVFIVTLGMGILGRTIPQLNVMLNNVPITIGVGLLVLGLSLPLFGSLAESNLTGIGPTLQGLLSLMGHPQ